VNQDHQAAKESLDWQETMARMELLDPKVKKGRKEKAVLSVIQVL
jgi:hypothetical protein